MGLVDSSASLQTNVCGIFEAEHVCNSELKQVRSFLPKLSHVEVMEGAYRRSAGRQTAFIFAQGAVVGICFHLHGTNRGLRAAIDLGSI